MLQRLAILAIAWLLTACAVTPSSAPGDQPDGAYKLDPEHVSVLFRVRHLGLSYVVGRFDNVDAALDFDADAPETSRLVATIQANSISTGLPAFDETLRADPWLAAASNPEIRFESRSIEITGADTGRVTGALTLRGVTREAVMDVRFYGGAPNVFRAGRQTLAFHGEMAIDRRAFGLTRFASDVVGDTIAIEIEAKFLEARE